MSELAEAEAQTLLELELILATVKQIDTNLQKSISLLDSREGLQPQLVTRNVDRIRAIVEQLQTIREN